MVKLGFVNLLNVNLLNAPTDESRAAIPTDTDCRETRENSVFCFMMRAFSIQMMIKTSSGV